VAMVDVCSLKTLVGWLCRLSVSQVDRLRYGEYHSTAHDSNRALSDQKHCILGSRFIGRVKDYFILPRYATSIDESSRDRIYTRERLTGEPASPRLYEAMTMVRAPTWPQMRSLGPEPPARQ
jgi:hypothetical protein